MKKTLALVLTLALVFTAVFTLAACNNDTCKEHVDEDGNYTCDKCGEYMGTTYEITMWVSETVKKDANGNEVDSVVKMTQRQVDNYNKANPATKFVVKVEGVSEADAGSKVVADVATAPDIYCFAQDQLARLVQAAALAAPGKKAQENIAANNDEYSVKSAKVAGTIYAYPMSSDNGYFLYYDKSVVTDPENLESIIADCNKAGKKFRYALENAWYTASFFFATGCSSTWTTDETGKFISVDDNFNSDKGLIAMKGMQKLAQAECYDSNADIFTDCAAIVTGVWNSQVAATYFGDNLAATDLPSFTVDGESYHLGSYSGFKYMGVKPQTDAKKAAALQSLAQYLTSEECQLERFSTFGWGPSNVEAQKTDAVKADPSIAAFAKQSANAIPQPQISGSWWDIAKVLGAEAKKATSDADLQKALDNYDAAIAESLNKSDDELEAWSVIGSVCGTSWNTDFKMTPNADKTVWTSDALSLTEGEEFKIRQGGSWDNNYGANGVSGGDNIKVETTGKYIITLTLTGSGANVTATITLTPAE